VRQRRDNHKLRLDLDRSKRELAAMEALCADEERNVANGTPGEPYRDRAELVVQLHAKMRELAAAVEPVRVDQPPPAVEPVRVDQPPPAVEPTEGEGGVDQPTAGEGEVDQPTAGEGGVDQPTAGEAKKSSYSVSPSCIVLAAPAHKNNARPAGIL